MEVIIHHLPERNSKSQKLSKGTLVTQDPITNTVILAEFFENGDEIRQFHLIPGTSIEKIEKFEENQRDPKIFDKYLNYEENEEESEEEVKKRALKIVSYLRSHHIDVVEKSDGIYEISGIVKFGKPYKRANFYCDIPLVLQRILKLIDQIE
ncbi:unnamed protein product [Caenorhabditis angaria]|uniref:AD domain-containing protein n=1 Tax=Caenorhabditis angaria TaxID=860376 RepID=A0A9P1I735_9PELO|nr:unnamed protein product [Caenorhabditis angaria]